jgi:hypothetical protein
MKNKKVIIIVSGIVLLCCISIIIYMSSGSSTNTTNTDTPNSKQSTSQNTSQNSSSTNNPTAKPKDPLINLPKSSEPSVYKKVSDNIISKDQIKKNAKLILSENSFMDIYNYIEPEDIKEEIIKKNIMSEEEYNKLKKTITDSVPPADTRFLFRNKRYNLCPDADVIASSEDIDEDIKKQLPPNAFFGGFCASNLSNFRYDPFTNNIKLSGNMGMCLYAPDLDKSPNNLIAKKCNKNDKNQLFVFDAASGKIKVRDKNICLEGAGMYEPITVSDCQKTYENEKEAKRQIFEIK